MTSGERLSPSATNFADTASLYDDPETIQGDVPDVQMVSKSFNVQGGDHPFLTSDEHLQEFLLQEPQKSFIETQHARGNVVAAARKASQAILTIASNHEKELLGAAGATLAVGTAAVVLWHRHKEDSRKK